MKRGGFSWKKFAGIPLTKSGRDQKIGRMITRGGCVVVLFFPLAILACAIIFI
jgi:hypothetical protein